MNVPVASAKKFLYVFTTGPYSSAMGQEGLDAVLVGAAFELEISVLFMHDGVFQLKAGQDTEATLLKQFTRTFRALPDYGVQNCYVLDSSLAARGLAIDQLIVTAEPLSQPQVAELISRQDRVFTF